MPSGFEQIWITATEAEPNGCCVPFRENTCPHRRAGMHSRVGTVCTTVLLIASIQANSKGESQRTGHVAFQPHKSGNRRGGGKGGGCTDAMHGHSRMWDRGGGLSLSHMLEPCLRGLIE